MNCDNKTINAAELLQVLEKERQWWETEKRKLQQIKWDEMLATGHIRGLTTAIDKVKELAK